MQKNERLRNELHATKERISTKIDNLEHDKRKYEWDLMVYNSKRRKPTEPDPTATAMHGFIDNMIGSLNKKKSELRQLDTALNRLSDTPQKSNCTP